MVDGVHFAEHLCVVALGIGIDGTKHPRGGRRRHRERHRGHRPAGRARRPGSGHHPADPVRPRRRQGALGRSRPCSTTRSSIVASSKKSEVIAKLPDPLASTVAKKIRVAYHDPDALAAEATLEELARQLTAQPSRRRRLLREGLAETLTVTRLGVPPTLARTLRSTNPIESMIEICRDHSSNVKRWRDGQMALRWSAAGMVKASKQFRRVNGFMHLPALPDALEPTSPPPHPDRGRQGGRCLRVTGPPPKFHGTRSIVSCRPAGGQQIRSVASSPLDGVAGGAGVCWLGPR